MAKDKKIFTEDLAAALRTPFESGIWPLYA